MNNNNNNKKTVHEYILKRKACIMSFNKNKIPRPLYLKTLKPTLFIHMLLNSRNIRKIPRMSINKQEIKWKILYLNIVVSKFQPKICLSI